MPHKNQYMYTAGITFSMRTTMSLILLQGKEQQLKRLLKKLRYVFAFNMLS